MNTERLAPRASAQIAAVGMAAAAIGLFDAGLVQTGLLSAKGSFQYVPGRIWILAPVVWLALAAVLAALILPVMRRWGGIVAPALLAAVFAGIRLRYHLVLLLATLAAFTVLLVLVRHWILRWMASPRRTIAVCVVGGVIASAIVGAAPSLTHAQPPPAHGAAGPNVILIFLDTVRADAVFDGEGHVRDRLPTLTRLRAVSTLYTRAYSTTSWTLPSHLSAVTGLPASQLGIGFDSQVYARADPTLAERFRGQGYRTAAVISNSFLNAGSGFARGFGTFQQAQAALDLCRTAPGVMADTHWPWFSAAVCNWTASEVTRRALALMDDSSGPFFLTLNYMDAHDPYYVERACGEPNSYAAALRCLDRSLAPIVDWRSPRRPTLLVVAGDHGEQFGEHGLTLHGNSLYTQLLHVPLMIRPIDGATGGTNTQAISLAALPSLIGADGPAGGGATGRGTGPVVSVLHPPAVARRPSQWSALDNAWHLIVSEQGPEALFYLPSDPAEEHDLSASHPSDPAIDRLRAAIEEMRRDPKPDLQKFRSLGYIH